MPGTKSKKTGIKSFKPACKVCQMPELAALEEARKKGVTYAVLARYLEQMRGYEDVTDDSVRNHFRRKHTSRSK